MVDLLQYEDAFNLVQHLVDQTNNPKSLSMLEQLFSTYGNSQAALQHCARCHQLFDPANRQQGECKIHHANSFVVVRYDREQSCIFTQQGSLCN